MVEINEDLSDAFDRLNLKELDSEVIEEIWNSNFSLQDEDDTSNQPNIIDVDDFCSRLRQLSDVCGQCIEVTKDDSFWLQLQGAEIDFKGVLVIVFYALEKGLKKDANFEAKKAAVESSILYLTLVSISGATAFNVFNSFLYQKTMDCIRMCGRVVGRITTADLSTSSRRGTGIRGRGRGRGKGSTRPSSRQSDHSTTQADIAIDSDNDIEEMTVLLEHILAILWQFLGVFSLKDRPQNVKNTIVALRELFAIDAAKAKDIDEVMNKREFERKRYLSEKVFACFHQLKSENHDEGARLLIERAIAPRLMLLGYDGQKTATIPAPLMNLRSLMTKFTNELLEINNESVNQSLFLLAKNLCVRVTDKSDYRAKMSETVSTLVLKFDDEKLDEFVNWLYLLAQTEKSGNRGFAVDLGLAIVFSLSLEKLDMIETLLKLILMRCSDKISTVRIRGITAVGALLAGENENLAKILVTVSVAELMPSEHNQNRLFSLFARRCDDEKVMVRKAAVHALEALVTVIPQELWPQIVTEIQTRCSDTALSVRKNAAESLTRLLLKEPHSDLLQNSFLAAVLPLITDRESSVQELVGKLSNDVIFGKLHSNDRYNTLAWNLLRKIEQQRDSGRCLLRVMMQLVRQSVINKTIVSQVEAQSTGSNENRHAAAWMLLADLSKTFPVDPRGARVAWYILADLSNPIVSYIARIIALSSKRLTDENANELLNDMKGKINQFRIDPENVSSVMYAVVQLEKRLDEKMGQQNIDQWVSALLDICQEKLSSIAYKDTSIGPVEIDEKLLKRYLFVMGEGVQLCPKAINQRMVYMVEALIVDEMLKKEISQTIRNSQSTYQRPSTVNNVPISVSAAVKACAVITLGKICIQDDEQAKKCMTIFIRELRYNPDSIIRNNIVVVLADLCIRSTSLIERHLGSIAQCLKDPAPLVRKQTITLLTGLLKEDFLRWKGVLLYRFLSTLLDSNEEIRTFAEFCLINVLMVRFPDMFYNHFIECLFSFNGVTPPTMEISNMSFSTDADSTSQWSLKGPAHSDERLTLYLFMLRQFDDIKKFQITSKLCRDIVGMIAEESIEFNQDTQQLLLDALGVLSAKEIKLSITTHGQNDEDEEVGTEQAREAMKKVVTALQKKAMIEHIVPHICSLKLFLQRNKSPLLKNLMVFLQQLMKDYRNEIQEVLAADRQLAAEIEFDMRRFEDDEERFAAEEVARIRAERRNEEETQNGDENEEIQDNQEPMDTNEVEKENAPVDVETPMEVENEVNDKLTQTPPRPVISEPTKTPTQVLSPSKAAAAANRVSIHIEQASPENDEKDEEHNKFSQVIDDDIGLAARAISTPDATHMPEVTFQLGNDFTLTLSPKVSPPRLSRPRRLAKETIKE